MLLRLLAAEVEQRHQQAREEDAHRVQPADEGDDDRGETVAGRDLRRQLAHRPGDFAHAGDAGHRAAGQQTGPDRARRGEAGVARRVFGLAGDLHLETAEAALHEHVSADQRRDSQHQGRVQARALQQHRQQRGVSEQPRLREVETLRVFPRPVDQPRSDELRDVDQHQRHQDLAGAKAGSQERRNGGPEPAADCAGERHQGQRPPAACRLGQPQRDAAGADRAQDELAFGTDVPHIGAVADREANADQHQRRGLEQELGHAVQIVHRVDEINRERKQRVLAEQREHRQAAGDRQRHRDQRRQKAHALRGLGTPFKPGPHGAPLPGLARRPRARWKGLPARRATGHSSRHRSSRR